MRIAILLALALLAGCETIKVPMATGGSRADGIITMAYEYGMFQKPMVDWTQSDNTATRRCQRWGYATAERFEGTLSQCTYFGQYGCERWRVTTEYQCVE